MAYQPSNDFDSEYGISDGVTTLRDRQVAQRYTTVADSVADGLSNIWAATNANGGTVTNVTGEGLIQTSANAAGSAQSVSTVVPYLPGQVNWFNSAFRFGNTGATGNIRRIGVFTLNTANPGVPQDGFAFELNGTTFNIVTYRGGVATTVASTAFSKVATAPFTLGLDYTQFEIRFTSNRADFIINNVLRHTATGGANPISNTLNFPMVMQNINGAGAAATNQVLAVRNIGMGRFGTPDQAGVYIPEALVTANITTQNLVPAGAATAGSAVELTLAGRAGASIQVTGTYTGALSLQGTLDGTNWVTIGAFTLLNINTGIITATIPSASPGIYQTEVAAFTKVRVTGLAAMTGTAVVTLEAISAPAVITVDQGKITTNFVNRVVRNFFLNTFTAAPAADAMQSVEQWYNNAAVAATVSPVVVPTGKVLKLTSWWIETKSLATVGSAMVRIRANIAGTAVLASPIVDSFSAGSMAGATTTAMTGAFCGQNGDFGEGGLEFPAGTGVGFSMAGYGPAGALALQGVTRFGVRGYEYSA